MRKTVPLIQAALKAGLTASDIDAVRAHPQAGTVGALLVGATVGRSPGILHQNVPAIPVHTIWKGICWRRCWKIITPDFPFVALLVSGGHTQLISVTGIGRYELLGEDRLTMPPAKHV
ncbi:hypothetical protein KCP71_10050 [Salmonella enterica subsp. enterica]|nr:hypothetical protein KCP71_10050 [Salmonella enterica subsp. enterica]